jgi:hypothetical protein
MKKFIIDRLTWLRGEGSDKSRLYRPSDGKMCCLGQIACQYGYTKEEISGRSSPFGMYSNEIPNKNKFYEKFAYVTLQGDNREMPGKMMEINDDITLDSQSMENKLQALGLEMGIELEFIN